MCEMKSSKSLQTSSSLRWTVTAPCLCQNSTFLVTLSNKNARSCIPREDFASHCNYLDAYWLPSWACPRLLFMFVHLCSFTCQKFGIVCSLELSTQTCLPVPGALNENGSDETS